MDRVSGQIERTDGDRTGAQVWQDARDADQLINAAAHDHHDQDMANAIEACLNLDGKLPHANIDWGGFKITNLAGGTSRGDAMRIADFQDGREIWAGTTGGTANLQTVTLSPAIPALVAGMKFRMFVGLTNIGNLQLSINGLDPQTVLTRGGSALQAGEWRISSLEEVIYDGNDFRLIRSVLRRQIFTASGTYDKPAGLIRATVKVQAAGGGSGGAQGTSGSQGAASPGGGGGEYREATFNGVDMGDTTTVTIGNNGAAGATGNNPGGDAANTIFGGLITAVGGKGGEGGAASATSPAAQGGLGGTGGSTDPDAVTGFVIVGGRGGAAKLVLGVPVPTNEGGRSFMGNPPKPPVNGDGNGGNNYGTGGSGATNTSSESARAGAVGGNAIIIVEEVL